MRARGWLFGAVLAVLIAISGLVGCASRARFDFDREVVFARYKTFDWIAPPVRASEEEVQSDPDGPFTRNSLLDKRIRTAVNRNLELRGFRQVEDRKADFRLNYHVTFKEKLVGSGSSFGYFGRYYRGGFSSDFNWSVRQYQQGTIIIDVVDYAKDQLVWRGWVVSRNSDGNFDEAEINQAVDAILMRFPPGG